VIQNGWHFLFAENMAVSNLLGRLGAFTGHQLVYNGFGFASYLLCSTLLVLGVNLLVGKKILSLAKNLKYVLPGLLVFSVALAFIFQNNEFFYGGGVGKMLSSWLQNFLGFAGTAIVLLVVFFGYFVWQFNPKFGFLEKKKLAPTENKTPQENEASLEIESSLIQQPTGNTLSINDLYKEEKHPLDEQTVVENGNKLEDDSQIAVILPAENEEAKKPVNQFDVVEKEIPFTVERPTDDAQTDQYDPFPLEIKTTVDDDDFVDPPISPIYRPPIVTVVPAVPPLSVPLITFAENQQAPHLPLVVNKPVVDTFDGEENTELTPEMVAKLPPYDPMLELRDYKYPSLELLEIHGSEKIVSDPSELESNKNQIINTLKNYDISIQRIAATVGPTVTLYEIVPAPGVRISRIKNLEDDIALSLAALGIRIIAPIPGKGTIGIEVPNHKKSVVSMRSMLNSEKFQNNNFSLPIAIGKKIDNENFIVDLATMPHLLMAGATGQGKSVGLNAILVSLLYKKHPSQLKFVLVDPKKVELSLYRMIEKHFLAKLPGEEEPIITDTKKVVYTLNALCIEMDRRYDLLKEAGTRNLKEYNEKFVARRLNPQKGHEYLPFIVLVIDEFADLIMTAGKEVEMPIARLAQLARAVGVHLIIATQRPSVNIITGTIKANFPARIAFKVSSKIDSRTILDAGGAEQLIGKGDMLISYNGEITRLQCAFVDTPEVEAVCDFIGEQHGYPESFLLPEYVDEKDPNAAQVEMGEKDPLFEEAARLIVQNQMGSTSLIQRRMKLGYNRAGRLMDQLEQAGIVGPNLGSKAREVVVKTEADLNEMLELF
jgi:S-DNA-T family DNA segregation ATPase FtsK/SpoIIIE